MEQHLARLQYFRLQLIFGTIMLFLIGSLIWGFFYISQPEKEQAPKIAVPTAVVQRIPTASTPTIKINHSSNFTQEELSFPAKSPAPNSDYSHSGGVAVISNPTGATITLALEHASPEENSISYITPFRTTGIMVGYYDLTATKSGFQTQTSTITISEGEVTRIEINLKPL